jgi:small subunit ribosomal protein S21
MIEIRVKDSENFEAALRRFKKEVQQSGVLSEMRRREHYEKPSVKKKMKILAARKKARKRSI